MEWGDSSPDAEEEWTQLSRGIPHEDAQMEPNVVLVLAVIIAVLSIGFEFGRDQLYRMTPKALHAMLSQMFMELTFTFSLKSGFRAFDLGSRPIANA